MQIAFFSNVLWKSRAFVCFTLLISVLLGGGGLARDALAATAFCPPFKNSVPIGANAIRIAAGDVPALLQAARQSPAGTTLALADGLYRLSSGQSLEVHVPGLTIRSASGNRAAVILEGGYNNISINTHDVTIADITLRRPTWHNVQVRGERGILRPTIYNVHMLDAGQQLLKVSAGDGLAGKFADSGLVACSLLEYSTHAPGSYTNGVDLLAGKDWMIRDNVFRRIRSATGPAGPAILAWRNAIGTIVLRNLLVDCWRGIALGLTTPNRLSRGGAQVQYDHQHGEVRNNVILALHKPADAAIENNYANNSLVVHNTVYYAPELSHAVNWSIEYRFLPTTATIQNNLTNLPILKRTPLPLQNAILGGNIANATATWFRAIMQEDTHLASNALPINRGVSLLNIVTGDMDGERRPKGPAFDVGADEAY